MPGLAHRQLDHKIKGRVFRPVVGKEVSGRTSPLTTIRANVHQEFSCVLLKANVLMNYSISAAALH